MKRVLAWIGIVVLLFCYLMTFISAFFTNSSSHGWFSASVAATIIVPCFMYAYFMLAKTLDNRKQEELVREAQFRARMEALKQQKLKEKEAQEQEQDAQEDPSATEQQMPEGADVAEQMSQETMPQDGQKVSPECEKNTQELEKQVAQDARSLQEQIDGLQQELERLKQDSAASQPKE